MRSLRFLALGLFAATPLVLIAGDASACMAIGEPTIRIVRGEEAGETVRSTGYISEYDCYAMQAKTYCAVGVRVGDHQAAAAAGIELLSVRFIHQESGQELEGFTPTRNPNTAKSFSNELDGQWFGFHSIFEKKPEGRSGIEVRFEFTHKPGVSDDALVAAFTEGHVGMAEGAEDGSLVKTHHLEIVKVGGVTVLSPVPVASAD